jgi:aquaporin Z
MVAARLRDHWPEYLIEASCLGLFLVAAVAFATIIHHPDFPIRPAVPADGLRRVLMGAAMGLTAMAIIYSPLGARSGAHINPATTLTFLRLGRVHAIDAAAYVVAQFAGAIAGIQLARVVFAPWIAAPAVRFVATVPGPSGQAVAFVSEAAIAFLLMTVVLHVSNHARHARWTGVCAGLLVWIYIAVEEPLSGMSLNPARSFAPALLSGDLDVLWIYLTAPPLGMLVAAELFIARRGMRAVHCAKLHHHTAARCIFRCRFGELPS